MGKLIVIDGTDGSGKETQMNILQENLKKNNIEFMKVSFPNYASQSSSLVKMYLSGEFGQDAQNISPYIASTFYAVDRYATYKKDIEEYYNNRRTNTCRQIYNSKHGTSSWKNKR